MLFIISFQRHERRDDEYEYNPEGQEELTEGNIVSQKQHQKEVQNTQVSNV